MSRTRPIPATAIAVLSLLLAACTGAASTSDEPSSVPSAPAQATMDVDDAAATEPMPSGSPTTVEESLEVTISNFAFAETKLVIPAGTTVEWVNTDATRHTVSEGTHGNVIEDPAFDLELEPMARDGFAFDDPGTYAVTCDIHPTMDMSVVVE